MHAAEVYAGLCTQRQQRNSLHLRVQLQLYVLASLQQQQQLLLVSQQHYASALLLYTQQRIYVAEEVVEAAAPDACRQQTARGQTLEQQLQVGVVLLRQKALHLRT